MDASSVAELPFLVRSQACPDSMLCTTGGPYKLATCLHTSTYIYTHNSVDYSEQ